MSKTNRHFSILGLSILILFAAATFLAAQEGKVDQATVPFSNPGQPGTVKISLYMGGITVTGYSGQEVIVEARVRGTMLQEQDKEVNEKARGMRLIRSSSTGLTVTEEDNVMRIGSQSMKYPVDISVQVPFKTTLKLGGYQNGNITVENITGEIEVNNYNGSISLTGITGSVVANTFNGGLTVVFAGITPDKPMSFSTWNGDVDITMPADLRSTVKLYSEQGDIYSDFEIQMQALPKEAQKTERKAEGRFKIVFDKTIYGTIGGGGPEFSFKTYNGDVYLRKK